MAEKYWARLGYSALAVIIFICTLITIRWSIDFVTWATLDSGWAQAIGSIAAIVFAYYLGERQAATARTAATELRERDRRTLLDGILAICTAARERALLIRDAFEGESYDPAKRFRTYHHSLILHIIKALDAVPVIEIRDEIAISDFLRLKDQLIFAMEAIDKFDQDMRDIQPDQRESRPELSKILRSNILLHVDNVEARFAAIKQKIGI